MKLPQSSISTLMALVALVAFDFGLGQQLRYYRFVATDLSDLLLFGVLPMANVLALGLLPFLTRAGRTVSRPKLVGFDIFGGAGLVFFLVCSLVATRPIHEAVPELLWFLEPAGTPVFLVGATLLLLLPQLGFACFGAWFFGQSLRQGKASHGMQEASDWTAFP